jgi:FKBP12-rapamycin complex-associated protein
MQVELKESWYEKLHRWDEALEAYQRKRAAASEAGGGITSTSINYALGEMRCLHALAEWEPLVRLSEELWPLVDTQTRMQVSVYAACRFIYFIYFCPRRIVTGQGRAKVVRAF